MTSIEVIKKYNIKAYAFFVVFIAFIVMISNVIVMSSTFHYPYEKSILIPKGSTMRSFIKILKSNDCTYNR